MSMPEWMLVSGEYREEKTRRLCTYCGRKTIHTIIKDRRGEEKQCTCDECGSDNRRIGGIAAGLM